MAIMAILAIMATGVPCFTVPDIHTAAPSMVGAPTTVQVATTAHAMAFTDLVMADTVAIMDLDMADMDIMDQDMVAMDIDIITDITLAIADMDMDVMAIEVATTDQDLTDIAIITDIRITKKLAGAKIEPVVDACVYDRKKQIHEILLALFCHLILCSQLNEFCSKYVLIFL